MATRILRCDVRDIRFPTSRMLDGSDAMHAAPDYSSAYVVLSTDHPSGIEGHGLTFTVGRGTDIVVAAAKVLAPMVVGRTLESCTADMAGFWRHITGGDSQLRWIGPEKGVIHLATAAIVNALWDLWAKTEGKPLWKLLADMTPRELVGCVDFRYITDAIAPGEAIEMLSAVDAGKAAREAELRREGYPAYTTSAGWLGYDDDKIRQRCREAIAAGFEHVKLKVGRDLAEDARRCQIIRQEIGPDRKLMVDANQVWDVAQAIDWMRGLARFNPWWIEEPTSPDDVLGHAAIAKALNPLGIGVATGEHCHNRVMFKQFLQAGAMQFCQIDATRLGGVNECLAVMLMAHKFGVPICPHAGGVGLCELVQHLSMWDYIACSASLENRVIEYVDHLHEHFVEPVKIVRGRYMPPGRAGFSGDMKRESREEFEYPSGRAWT